MTQRRKTAFSRAQDEFRSVDLGNDRLYDLAVLLAERPTAEPSESISRPMPLATTREPRGVMDVWMRNQTALGPDGKHHDIKESQC